ncbi:hypothetical protein CHARACLAT_027958 [Characodon lateralis]|uniref:Uncharacterized protein n=1 Tax=Characodon lateralis TaxID=208331 RepID=A0ABU7EET9_9TELE|nr:hypothetical protein [Characodon lateralis]
MPNVAKRLKYSKQVTSEWKEIGLFAEAVWHSVVTYFFAVGSVKYITLNKRGIDKSYMLDLNKKSHCCLFSRETVSYTADCVKHCCTLGEMQSLSRTEQKVTLESILDWANRLKTYHKREQLLTR